MTRDGGSHSFICWYEHRLAPTFWWSCWSKRLFPFETFSLAQTSEKWCATNPLNALKNPILVFGFCQMTLSQHVATLFFFFSSQLKLQFFSSARLVAESRNKAPGLLRLDLGDSSLFQVAASDNLCHVNTFSKRKNKKKAIKTGHVVANLLTGWGHDTLALLLGWRRGGLTED